MGRGSEHARYTCFPKDDIRMAHRHMKYVLYHLLSGKGKSKSQGDSNRSCQNGYY